MKEFHLPHKSVFINIHEVITRKFVAPSAEWTLFPTRPK